MTVIETDRLILRPWMETDAESLFKYASDPDVGPIAGWAPHPSVDYSREIISSVFAAPDVYAVVIKDSGEPVGCCGMMPADRITNNDSPNNRDAEIGYWIGKPYWGLGLIPEAVNALINKCRKEYDITRLWIGFRNENQNSRRVAEKCGFKYSHTVYDTTDSLGNIITEHFYSLILKPI